MTLICWIYFFYGLLCNFLLRIYNCLPDTQMIQLDHLLTNKLTKNNQEKIANVIRPTLCQSWKIRRLNLTILDTYQETQSYQVGYERVQVSTCVCNISNVSKKHNLLCEHSREFQVLNEKTSSLFQTGPSFFEILTCRPACSPFALVLEVTVGQAGSDAISPLGRG